MKEFESDFLEMEDDEKSSISIIEIFSKLWSNRKRIIYIMLIFMGIGLFLALFSPEKYQSQCVFVPQMSQGLNSKYSSLASMMGLDMALSSSGADGQVNPRLYPLILDNTKFQRDLMNTKIHFEKASEPITLLDYYTKKEYQRFNIVGFISTYTIGLPRVLIGLVKKEKEPVVFTTQLSSPGSAAPVLEVVRLTKDEDMVARILSKNLEMKVDVKKGYLTLIATMPEAQAASELCQATFELLHSYICEFKKDRAMENLAFISTQLSEAKSDYQKAQTQLAFFMDANNNIDRATAKVQKIRLEGEYELARQMYSELSKQELSAKVKVNETTVAFTELAPATVPLKRTSPKRAQMMMFWTFFGFCAGCIYVYGKDKYDAMKKASA